MDSGASDTVQAPSARAVPPAEATGPTHGDEWDGWDEAEDGDVLLDDDDADESDDDADEIDDDDIDVTGSDLVRNALADAQRISRARPGRSAAARRRLRRQNLAGRGRTGWTGAGPDEHDPQRLGTLLSGYVEDRGWERPLAEARVFAEWPALVGADVAAHCTPTALQDGTLRISAESTAWATQLRLLSATMLARLVAELGPQVVTRLLITGPAAPSWKHGGLSVRGARGPRDTYG